MDFSSAINDASAIIPGYGIVVQIVSRYLGFDLGWLISKYLVLFAIFKASAYIFTHLQDYFVEYLTSSVEIDDNDSLFTKLENWAAMHYVMKKSTLLKASTVYSIGGDRINHDFIEDDSCEENGLFDCNKWSRSQSVIYKPNFQSKYFWHKNNLLHWARDERLEDGNRTVKIITLRCLSRSPEAIVNLLREVKVFSLYQNTQVTKIYHPIDVGNSFYWGRETTKLARPMSTIILDQKQKIRIIEDANEYLRPSTLRWYVERGIPYRRGYLFHGPPGTGKTSLSFALAGVFGLPIYCLSLGEAGLNESHLGTLFHDLPDRCILLVEDIDSAGVRRYGGEILGPSITGNESSDAEGEDDVETESGGKEKHETTKIAQTATSSSSPRGNSSISLAGLLNTLDGAASQEGRLLIMTTNCPESLDSALIRPGRVDQQVEFTLATREQIHGMFERMYKADTKPSPEARSSNIDAHALSASKIVLGDMAFEIRNRNITANAVSPEQLDELARRFATKVPEGVFSPADIQGFLLKRKSDPERAIGEVEEWCKRQMEARRKGKKVIQDEKFERKVEMRTKKGAFGEI